MTCVIGLESDGKVWMGGDSAAVDPRSLEIRERQEPKVFANGPYLLGFAGSIRVGNLLRLVWRPPTPPKTAERLDAFMASKFIDSLRRCVTRGGTVTQDAGTDTLPSDVLVGIAGRLYVVEGDFQIGRNSQGWETIGVGGRVAAGAMWALTKHAKAKPQETIRRALQASASLNASVRPPYTILCA